MFAAVLFSCLLASTHSADILAVFPHTGKSHFDVFEPLLLELTAKGHRLTVISFFPQKIPVANYTDVSLVGIIPVFVNTLKFETVEGMNPISDFITITNMGVKSCEHILFSTPVQDLLKSSRTFDLLLVEMFTTDCFLSLLSKFEAPYIGVSSSVLFPVYYPRLGNSFNPAYFPNLFFPFSSSMGFVQRVVNTVFSVGMWFARAHFFSVPEQKAVHRAFGREVALQSVAYNVSLALVNSHYSLQGSRPLVPGFVEVGGLHIHTAKPLDKELDQFLNDSSEGALLFSMGSVLQSTSFPEDKLQAIMDAFSELPIRVIMKWENDSLPGKPDNVRLSKWLPQRDILAHPNVVAFMAHGGLLSISEAVYCGVPMVLMPMFGDQPNNVAHLEASGAAVKLSFKDITKESILRALRAVLYDPRYRERARTLSAQYRDRPMSPLDTAVYWTEYVLRHKGAPHLRSPAVDMPWYQLWLIDVILALVAGLSALMLVVFWLAKRTTSLVSHLLHPNTPHSKID